jgi:hypothetical protein
MKGVSPKDIADNFKGAVISDDVLLTDAEWERITAVRRNLPNHVRPLISSFISVYRRLPQYKELEWRYDEAAILARKTAELIERIERYRNYVSVPESLRPEWQKKLKDLMNW